MNNISQDTITHAKGKNHLLQACNLNKHRCSKIYKLLDEDHRITSNIAPAPAYLTSKETYNHSLTIKELENQFTSILRANVEPKIKNLNLHISKRTNWILLKESDKTKDTNDE